MRGLLLCVLLVACSSVTPSAQSRADAECAEHEEDVCVTLHCGDDWCGFYRCEDVGGGVELARFPPARPPAAAAAPGRDPRRNRGPSTKLPGGAEPVMVFPWYGTPKPVPPQRLLPAGRFEKHHIFPQAPDLAEWFAKRGVNIHLYTLPIPRDVHRRIHSNGERGGEWNEAWRAFKRKNENPSPEELFKHAGELIYRFQLLGGPIEKYY